MGLYGGGRMDLVIGDAFLRPFNFWSLIKYAGRFQYSR